MGVKGRVMTGARARLIVNGVKIGYATGISWRASTEHAELEVLNNIEVEEHVPTRYRVSGSVKKARIVGENASTAGLWPKIGTNPEQHLTNILTQGDAVLQVEDSKTGKIIELFEQVKFTERSGSFW